MRTSHAWAAAALFAVLLLAGATAAGAQVTPKTANGITYVSGGVGAEEQAVMREIRPQYRLQMLFALQNSREFLANVPVTIVGAEGQALLQTTAEGPYLFVDLPPGTYQVTASHEGRAITRRVTVPKSGAIEERFFWTGP
jgi:hypothetical protein